jgi:catechol 2,3-dioxygenase-like lactoylglutathione lyase family enzyme
MIKRVKFVGLTVKDFDKALDFYTNKLGFEVVSNQLAGPGNRWIELRIPGADTQVVISGFGPPPDAKSQMPGVVFAVDDLDATYEELKKKGVEFTQPPRKEAWGSSAMFRDPDGNLVLLSTL